MLRPTRRVVKFFATAATIEPTVKRTNESRMSCLCSKAWDSEPKVGWNIVLVNRNDVPAQNAWIEEPPSWREIIWTPSQVHSELQ